MQAFRFTTFIDDEKSIKVPELITLPNAQAEVIVLVDEQVDQPKGNRDSNRWIRWLKEGTSIKGKVENWQLEEICNAE